MRRQLNIGYSWEGEGRLADALEAQVYVQSTDALQHTDQLRTSYSFINPVDPSTFGGTEAARSTDFEFNQLAKGVSLTTRKRLSILSRSHELVYGISLETTDTERPRDRCETALEAAITTCAIAAYPFAPPEEFPNRTFPDTRTERSGVFLQDEIVVGSHGRVTLIPGIRYDNYRMDPADSELAVVGEFGFEVTEVSEDNLSANLGLLYDVSSQISLSLQYSEGFRPPNFDESNQAFVNRAFGYATVPNPDLKPETSDGIEFGIRVRRDHARFGFSVYRNQYDDFINSEFVGSSDGISLFQDRNVGRAEMSGFEFSAGWNVNDRLTLHGALAQSRGTDLSSGDPLDNVEPLSGILGLIARGPNEYWELETLLTLVAKKDRVSSDDRVTSDAYGLIDIVGKLRPSPRTSLRIGIFNAFDESYARWVNLQGLAADDVNAIALAQASGRNLRAAFNFDF
jgi:hemoglobin/transferrin/lactoferrin receptor protein